MQEVYVGPEGVLTGSMRAAQEARAAAAIAAGLAAAGGAVAILVRARAHVRATLAELRRLGVRAACQDVDPLAELPAVRDVLALARALWHPEDRLSWAIVLRAPFVGLSWADLVALSAGRRRQTWPQRLAAADEAALSDEGRTRVARLASALSRLNGNPERSSLPERVETLWTVLGGPGCVDPVALGDVRRAFALLREHAADGLADRRAFDRAVDRLYAASGDGAVQVMTIHKAKGLEFEHVLLVGAGRRARAEDRPLLHFVETPQGPLLVPQPPRIWPESPMRQDAARLYDYTHRLHARIRSTESLRLLYVAATRARRTLDISFCAGTDKTGAIVPAAASFAGALLPGLTAGSVIVTPDAAPAAAPDAARSPPRAPRLPLDFVLPAEAPVFQPREQRALRPSEAVLSATETKRQDDEQDIYAQLVGTMLHQALAKIANEGLAYWADRGLARRPALRAGFRRLGLPEPQVEAAVARVLDLVGRTLAGAATLTLIVRGVTASGAATLAPLMETIKKTPAAITGIATVLGGVPITAFQTFVVPLLEKSATDANHPWQKKKEYTFQVGDTLDELDGRVVAFLLLTEDRPDDHRGPAIDAELCSLEAERPRLCVARGDGVVQPMTTPYLLFDLKVSDYRPIDDLVPQGGPCNTDRATLTRTGDAIAAGALTARQSFLEDLLLRRRLVLAEIRESAGSIDRLSRAAWHYQRLAVPAADSPRRAYWQQHVAARSARVDACIDEALASASLTTRRTWTTLLDGYRAIDEVDAAVQRNADADVPDAADAARTETALRRLNTADAVPALDAEARAYLVAGIGHASNLLERWYRAEVLRLTAEPAKPEAAAGELRKLLARTRCAACVGLINSALASVQSGAGARSTEAAIKREGLVSDAVRIGARVDAADQLSSDRPGPGSAAAVRDAVDQSLALPPDRAGSAPALDSLHEHLDSQRRHADTAIGQAVAP
ncbi:MAG: hypothetical protein NVS9B10_11780 [Nevskia sp.]